MAHSILIKNVFLDGRTMNILIEGNRIAKIGGDELSNACEIIDGNGLAALPAFYNTHTHAAMTLLRGYGGDNDLKTWLEEYIWPRENSLTPEDIYEGSLIAAREMIKSGTVFFCDMYFNIEQTIEVVRQTGIRACIGITFMNNHPLAQTDDKIRTIENWSDPTVGRISLCAAPHAIYTAGSDVIRRAHSLASAHGMKTIIHLSETVSEVDGCISEYGMRPVHYLDSLGVLDSNLLIAHAIHLDNSEIKLLAERGVTVSHCPCSNMKLSSGMFRYREMIDAGVRVTLGTDGCASNNNLDMREEMKFAALYAKCSGDPKCLPAGQVFDWATRCGAEAFGIDAGTVAEGRLADLILVRLDDERMQPAENLVSNWVYSAQSDCIDTTICNGKVLMNKRKLLI